MTTQSKQQTRILVQAAAAACEDKKGEETRILELDPIDSGLSDFFLVTSASNDRQAIAISDEIEHRLKKEFGTMPNSVEGRRQGEWILLDYVDFVVHVFLTERRAFYDIERLRKSARPLTPAEFDAELKAELSAKTLAARSKPTAKPKITLVKKAVAKKTTAKTLPAKKTATKKAVAKAAIKQPSAARTKSTPVARTKALGKPALKKTAAKKSAATKTKLAPTKKEKRTSVPSHKAKPIAKKSAAKTAAKKSPPKKTAIKSKSAK
jgi:ribosome-associated protein